MTIELQNIGMIKEVAVKIDGLTVIAGENDTGKSTVGKILMSLIKADNTARHKNATGQSKNFNSNRKNNFNRQIELLFDKKISQKGEVRLSKTSEVIYKIIIKNNECSQFNGIDEKASRDFLDCTFIQTPLVWDLYEFFVSIATLRTEGDIYGYQNNIAYPYILWDLYSKFTNKRLDCDKNIKLIKHVKEIISGEFIKDDLGKFYYSKENNHGIEEKIPLKNIATGIKVFGILQILLENCYINPHGFFIFDEPENHLHPKWQLTMAKIIVELVKNGVKILVNSHSPYMIEALKRYSDLEKLEDKTNFYLAEEGYIKKINDSNSETLVVIYEKLSEPYDIFEQMESDRFTNG